MTITYSFQYVKLRLPLLLVCRRGSRQSSSFSFTHSRRFYSKSTINPQILEKAKVINPADQNWTSKWIAPEDIRIISYLSSYLWPSKDIPNSFYIKSRVIISLSLLLSSKVINVYVPFLFKDLIDSLSIVSSSADLVTMTPIALILGYGISRSTSAGDRWTAHTCIYKINMMLIIHSPSSSSSSSLGMAELRNAIFATVAQDAIRKLSRNVLEHLHKLDLQFHLDRNTGRSVVCCDDMWYEVCSYHYTGFLS